MNPIQAFGRLLMVITCGAAAGAALAQCPDSDSANCDDAFVFDGLEMQESLRDWLSFSMEADSGPMTYDVPLPQIFLLDDGLRFELPTNGPTSAGSGNRNRLSLRADGEPAFALLFGNVARLLANGTMALGRGDVRSNSPENLKNQWSDLLPAAYKSWNDRLDVDLGLSYSGQNHFATSLGFSEKIGNQNEAAVVGWFEYRF
jgi:hypothetical protein